MTLRDALLIFFITVGLIAIVIESILLYTFVYAGIALLTATAGALAQLAHLI